MATAPPTYTVEPTPFPAASKTTSGIANNLLTTISRIAFTDRLLITILQGDRSPSHWIHVPLVSASSSEAVNPMGRTSNYSYVDPEEEEDGDVGLLPRFDLTATTLLGGTKREDEVVGQTLATMIGSAVLMKRPSEERLMVLGLGLEGSLESMSRQGFEEVTTFAMEDGIWIQAPRWSRSMKTAAEQSAVRTLDVLLRAYNVRGVRSLEHHHGEVTRNASGVRVQVDGNAHTLAANNPGNLKQIQFAYLPWALEDTSTRTAKRHWISGREQRIMAASWCLALERTPKMAGTQAHERS
ncbi:hypothetical protein LTS10_000173 [Elasticomyces elasticus]|nr:hypothetical protein LTS10_000173 [Elasticomyces elasticus]